MSSSIASSMLFLLLLLMFSNHMDEALGARTKIRILKETIMMRRNLKRNGLKSSKIDTAPSASKHCGGGKRFKNMATTYGHDDQFSPLPGGDSSSLCIRCVTTKRCVGVVGAPPESYTCTSSTNCETIPGP